MRLRIPALCLAVGTSVWPVSATAKMVIGPATRGAEVSLYSRADNAAAEKNPSGAAVPADFGTGVRVLRETDKAYEINIRGGTKWVYRGEVTTDDERQRRCQKRSEMSAGRGVGCD